MRKTTEFEVWSEGFRVTGDSGTAVYHGVFGAETFSEACAKAARKHSWGDLFDADRLTYWGCRLFANEADARRSFG